MSDTPNTTPEAAKAMPAMPFQINTQYVKDLSFENPHPLKFFSSEPLVPEISVNIAVNAEPVGENVFEVCLSITVDAKIENDTAFLTELVYGGIFSFEAGLVQEEIKPLLLIECPRFLFPFARHIISDTTSRGGFPPVSLSPIDFAALYRQQQTTA